MDDFKLDQIGSQLKFTVKVVPASSKTAYVGSLGDMLKIKVAAVAEKGKANQCLINFLAKILQIKKNKINISSGQTNPIKQITIDDLSADEFKEKMNKLSLKC